MKPPPPMLPANGCVTASANAVATAASTALPPFVRMAAPMSDATSDAETTTPAGGWHAEIRTGLARLGGRREGRGEDDRKGGQQGAHGAFFRRQITPG